jgi:hypothetical protein
MMLPASYQIRKFGCCTALMAATISSEHRCCRRAASSPPWYRDLGHDNGHLWGHVQAIKRSTLLEITGPMFMSYALVSNIQYRLTPVDGGALITFRHSAMG